MLNSNLTAQGPNPYPLFKLVHYAARNVRKRAVGIRLKCLLATYKNEQRNRMSFSHIHKETVWVLDLGQSFDFIIYNKCRFDKVLHPARKRIQVKRFASYLTYPGYRQDNLQVSAIIASFSFDILTWSLFLQTQTT